MGLREFTKRPSSARFALKAGAQIAAFGAGGGCNGLSCGLASFDKAVCLASNY
jgi:hypothetical protein